MRCQELSAAGIFALMAVLFFLSPPAYAAHFNYLYIEASEGNSSGGHTAIQFDDEIYHYQHDIEQSEQVPGMYHTNLRAFVISLLMVSLIRMFNNMEIPR